MAERPERSGSAKVRAGTSSSSSGTTSRRRHLADTRLSQLGDDALKVVSFQDKPELLRSSSLAVLMRCFSAIFTSSAGSASTYQLSESVAQIHVFLSHNWAVRRWRKSVGLCMHFNFDIAAVCTLLYGILGGIAGAVGLLPSVVRDDRPYGYVCRLTVMPVFFLVFLTCRDVMWFFGHGGQNTFLDKTCIHQTDHVLKAGGIEKLGAFLNRSHHMVVLYTDMYLTKIWTVFEVAAFLSLHPVENMIVLPLHQSIVLCSTYVVLSTGAALSFVLSFLFGEAAQSYAVSGYIAFLFMIPVLVHVLRRWAKAKQHIIEKVSSFTVDGCTCFSEADRPLVYNNIRTLMVACGLVDETDGQVEALRHFDMLVRSEVLGAVYMRLGKVSFDYKHYAMAGFAAQGGVLLDGMVFSRSVHASVALLHYSYTLGWIFGYVPLLLMIGEVVSSSRLQLTGCRELLHLAMVSLAMFLLAAGMAVVPFLFVSTFDSGTGLCLSMLMHCSAVGGALVSVRCWRTGRTIAADSPPSKTTLCAKVADSLCLHEEGCSADVGSGRADADESNSTYSV